jgi:hypothetical protein
MNDDVLAYLDPAFCQLTLVDLVLPNDLPR